VANVVAGIFARGGSKGIPRKNLRLLGGKPLLVHAIDSARAVSLVSRVVVSTDDEEIAELARASGAEVPFLRPTELSTDTAPEFQAWQHLIRHLEAERKDPDIDILLTVPTTSPLRAPEDLERCLQLALDSDADVVITVRPAERSPYFNMVTIDADGVARLVIAPPDGIYQRQAAPLVFDITTVAYAAKTAFVLTGRSLFEGKVRAVVVPSERAVDIDTPLDFEIAEFLYRRTLGQ